MLSPNPQCMLNMIKEPEFKNTSEHLIIYVDLFCP